MYVILLSLLYYVFLALLASYVLIRRPSYQEYLLIIITASTNARLNLASS